MKPSTRVSLALLPFLVGLFAVGAVVAYPLFTPAPAVAGASSLLPGVIQVKESQGAPSSRDGMVELEVRDVVPLEELGTHAVMLVSKDGGSVLPIFVSEEAAVSIAFRLAERTPPHPLAADLLDRVVDSLGGSVTEIRIDDIQDEVFTGRIFIQQGKKNLELNARPSDAICMALGSDTSARIYASQKVMAEGGISKDEIDQLRRSMPGVGGSGPEGGPGAGGIFPPLPPSGAPARGGDGGISL